MPQKNVGAELKKLGESVLNHIEKGENPNIDIPLRTLSNVIFDKKLGQLTLGGKSAKRYFFNVAHSKKFMQTLMVAGFCNSLLEEGIHTSIRDMYYNLKRTLPQSDENTFDEQSESICPDEPLLVKMDGDLRILSGEDLMRHAEKSGKVIYDKNGKKRIVGLDLYTYAFDENQKIREQKVSMVIKHPSNKIKKIKTSSGREVKVTKSHSLFTLKDGKVTEIKTNELKEGDMIALPRKISIKENNKPINVIDSLLRNAPDDVVKLFYVKSDKDTINEVIKRVGKERIRIFSSNNYKNIWSDVKANWKHWNTVPIEILRDVDLSDILSKLKIGGRGSRHYYNVLINKDSSLGFVLGFLISEGSHSIFEGRNSRYVSISNKSKMHLQNFWDAFKHSFGETTDGNIILGKDDVYKLNIGYDTLSYILEYVIGYKPVRAWEKEVPHVILDAPQDCIKEFLRSFRLGDGSVFEGKMLVNGLVFLLLRHGIFPRIYHYKISEKNPNHKDAYEIRIGPREYVKNMAQITHDFMGIDIEKTRDFSSDMIPNVGSLLLKTRKSCDRQGIVYRERNIGWNYIENKNSVSRLLLNKMSKILDSYGASQHYLDELNEHVESDIYWDSIISIEDDEMPPYTLDLAVPPHENFIGGNGLLMLHNSDPLIVDLEVALDVLREQLHLTTDRKGIVAGNVVIEDRGDSIDWSKLGSGGWSIPSTVDEIKLKKVDAKFVLVCEKNAGFERLHEDKFWQKQKCILVGTGGQPSRGARLLIQRLNSEYDLPVYVFCDNDAYGFYIYSVIKSGSISLAHVSDRISTPEAKFIGLTTSDIYDYNLKKCTIKLKEVDIKRAKELLEYEWFKKNPKWQKEINLMLEKGVKAEIEALSHRGLKFMSEEYLPDKIKKGDFLD